MSEVGLLYALYLLLFNGEEDGRDCSLVVRDVAITRKFVVVLRNKSCMREVACRPSAHPINTTDNQSGRLPA